ncbi:MAG: hypothetical protein K2G37_01600 [Clostridia bacterium]|nr:hypothetical protein [Clostridia bacterium]MDE7328506.1 hypothetical protein [Clostridia bacterium]
MNKKRIFFIAAVLVIACVFTSLFCACSPTSITAVISKDNIGVEIADTMYGLFLEDISFAGDGGLISELVNNGSFEYQSYPTAYWNIDCAEAKIETSDGLNPSNPSYLRLNCGGNATIENLGFVEFYDTLTQNYNQDKMTTADMGFHEGVEYDVSLYVRLNGFEGKINAKLNSPSNTQSETFDVSQVEVGEWTKVSAVLKSAATEDGSLVIEFEGSGSVDVDFVSLIPHDTHGYGSNEWKYVTLREDLYQALENLSPAFIRFPGGCLAEGDSFEHLFNWKNTIGKLEEREQYLNIWRDDENGLYYNNTFALGYHEYFQLCEDLDAKPLPILNVGMICQFEMKYNANYKLYSSGKMTEAQWEAYLDSVALRPGTTEFNEYLKDITDLIEYANSTDPNNEWVKKRIENGHPEPFNIEYLGLGNENWGELYWRNFDVLYNAVKAYCEENGYDITIISSASYQFSGEYIDNSWEIINEKYTDTLVDEHYYTSQNKLFKYNDRYDNYERTGATVFVGEYAASAWGIGKYWTQNNMWSAIEEASYMTALERNGDLVKMASYAPAFAKINAQRWKINMIWFDSQSIVLTPNYFNQMLFANNTGNKYIETGISGKGVYSSTSIDEEEQVIYVKIVNANKKSIDVSLDFNGFGPLNASNMQYMSGVRAACNELGVTTVAPYQQDCNVSGSNVNVTINGESINIIRVYYGDNDGSNAYNLPELPENMQREVTEYTKFFVVPELAIVYGSCALAVLIAIGVGVIVWVVKKRKKKGERV